ncbi:hypothetical protein GWI33_004571 [Rhynchophorus ferrugineus]|uniref:Uncharacterized protein n=1 Tax=Rhynchophorus ferrugineus TaxID=354439 RepID=A0A834MGN4_RHYFE|nr:hypothetical protein GWI33_004571 [Rhynchophorus ferrugineus]
MPSSYYSLSPGEMSTISDGEFDSSDYLLSSTIRLDDAYFGFNLLAFLISACGFFCFERRFFATVAPKKVSCLTYHAGCCWFKRASLKVATVRIWSREGVDVGGLISC